MSAMAVILFGHGARDPEWSGPIERVRAAMRARQPELRVELAFLEFMHPSLAEAVASLHADVSSDELNRLMQGAAASLPGLLAYSDDPHASIDFNHHPQSAIVDGCQTRTSGTRLANLMVWFDNEWGYANRMLDVANYWRGLLAKA